MALEMLHHPYRWLLIFLLVSIVYAPRTAPYLQLPITYNSRYGKNHEISSELFADLEELSRVVDITYCVGLAGTGIQKPFLCASRCQEFKSFELVTVRILGLKQENKAY